MTPETSNIFIIITSDIIDNIPITGYSWHQYILQNLITYINIDFVYKNKRPYMIAINKTKYAILLHLDKKQSKK